MGQEVSLPGFHLLESVNRQIMENCTKIIEQIVNSINSAVLKSINPVNRRWKMEGGVGEGRRVRTLVSCHLIKGGIQVVLFIIYRPRSGVLTNYVVVISETCRGETTVIKL